MKTDIGAFRSEFIIIRNDDDEPVLASDHRGVFVFADWKAERFGAKGHEDLDDQTPVVLLEDDFLQLLPAAIEYAAQRDYRGIMGAAREQLDVRLGTIADRGKMTAQAVVERIRDFIEGVEIEPDAHGVLERIADVAAKVGATVKVG